MTDKCLKFESLFIFADEETLKHHIANCEDCRKESEKFEKVSNLIQEVKPILKKKTVVSQAIKVACLMLVLFISGLSFSVLDSKYAIVDNLRYGQAISIEDMGLPVDSYGLLMVN